MKQPVIKSRILHSLGSVVFKLGDVAKAKEHFEFARGLILNQAEYLDLIKETDTKIKECCQQLGQEYEEPEDPVYKMAEQMNYMN